MAEDFDGSYFVGLHDECVGDGSTSTQPVDVFLSQTILGNGRRLNIGMDGATCAFWQEGQALDEAPNANTGDRPWASVDWSMPVAIPFVIQPGLDSVELQCLWIAYEFGTADAIDIEWRLCDGLNNIIATTEIIALNCNLIWDDQVNDEVGITRFNVDLQNPWSGVAESGTLYLRIRSRIGDDTTSNVDLDQNSRPYSKENSNRDFRPDTSGPTSGDVGITALYQSSLGVYFDVLGVDTQSSPNPDFIYIDPQKVINADVTCDIYHMSYIQCRAIQIRPVYDRDSLGDVDERELRARQPIESSPMTRLAQQPTSYHKRKRLLAWGPAGYKPDRLETWPSSYHTRFTRVDGTGQGAIIDVPLTLPWVNGVLEVTCDLVAVFGERNDGTVDIGSSVWDVTTQLVEFDSSDTDWSSPTEIASQDSSLQMDTVATMPLLGSRFLTSERIWRYPRGTIAVGNTGFPTREGQLFDEDIKLRRRRTFSIEVSNVDMDMPYRLQALVTADMGELVGFPLYPESGLSTSERLYLVCTGFTVWGYGT